jgi:hypothetical protein
VSPRHTGPHKPARWQDGCVTKRRTAAPNPERVLMYLGGLTRGHIAKLVGTASSTVGYHLDIARANDPELQATHDRAAALRTTHHPTAPGLEHLSELVALVEESAGTRQGQRQRIGAAAGRLVAAPARGRPGRDTSPLAVLPGWQTPARRETDAARWQERLAALVEDRLYRCESHLYWVEDNSSKIGPHPVC